MLALLLSVNAFALGLGDIRLSSALNEPLRARIELLSATPEELEGLKVQLASPDTFSRYGIDRPLWLTRLQFNVVRSASGAVVEVRSRDPITEPFVTFLVEATWPSGRLLREYTVLLDPPTFAPPPAAEAREAVTAPSRATPADAGRIERPAAREPAPAPAPAARQAAPAADTAPFDATAGGEVQVQRGDTLWGIAQRVRPDDRLSMNQTMLAIYEANPDAFAGNINRLVAGARLSIPSADDIFRISRNDAMSEVQRQNQDFGIAGPAARTQPSLTLVPPDGEQEDYGAGTTAQQAPGSERQTALQQRIQELEETVADQQSLLEIRDNELARLRQELARMREPGAVTGQQPAPAEEPVVEPPVAPGDEAADEVFTEDDEISAEDQAPVDAEEPAAEPTPVEQPSPRVVRATPEEPGLVDRLVELLTGIWGIIGLALLLAVAVLLWFARRAAGREEESTGVWEALDAEEDDDVESRASTERLRALARDDDASIVVVEQESAIERRRKDRSKAGDTVEVSRRDELDEDTSETGAMPALDDTFSSETAINLDQSDPIAEADFHMAYGLYDQAADLVNAALATEPERQDLMAKLCEIYFVWGNRDAFVDAAGHLNDQLGGETTPDWDKIVIMGQQLAPDHRLFAGRSAAGATREVDLSFDDSGDSNVLDMDFGAGGPDDAVSDVIDLGAEEDSSADQSGLDFVFDAEEFPAEEETGATTTREAPLRGVDDESTVESPTIESRASDRTIESPTVEQPLESLESTSELPAFRDHDRESHSGDATAEIDLDDLGLDLDALAQSGLEDIGDDGDFDVSGLDETSENRVLGEDDETGRNQRLDEDLDATTEMPLASDDETTGSRRAEHDDTDVEFDSSLLAATGHTQVLSDDFAVEATSDDDDATLLASFDDEDDKETVQFSGDDIDFDFAETEALPKDSYKGTNDETGEIPQLGGDVDLDLDDLTAALRTSEGDTVEQARDEETVEQPIRGGPAYDDDDTPTEALSPDDLSDDLHDARTMTEVGTKLDLARAYVDMGDPEGARSILEEVLDEGDEGQRQQAQKLIDSLPD
jgi:pilus assembly protein FimV